MNNKKKSAIIGGVCVCMLLIAACSTVTCPMDTVVTCNYLFYNTDGVATPLADTLNVSIKKDVPIYVYSKEGHADTTLTSPSKTLADSGYVETRHWTKKDTTLVNKLVNGSQFKVAMSYYRSVDTLILHYGLILWPDTVYVSHDSYTHVETPECGSYRFHRLTGIRCTNRGIDHIEISNPTVNYEGAENVRIYFNNFSE